MAYSRMAVLVMAVLMIGVATRVAEGQSTPACANNLIPCANFINSTNPPSSCCNPLREAVTNQLDCLCNLYQNPELFRSLGINITQALLLPQRCRIPGDISACKDLKSVFNSFCSLGSKSVINSRFHSSSDSWQRCRQDCIRWIGKFASSLGFPDAFLDQL